MHWHCPRHQDFALRRWEDGGVLHDAARGQLHFLSPASSLVLHYFLDGLSWSGAALAQQLLDTEPTSEDLALLEEQLHQLARLKLITPRIAS